MLLRMFFPSIMKTRQNLLVNLLSLVACVSACIFPLSATPPEINSEEDARALSGSHPTCGSLADHYTRAFAAYQKGNIVNVSRQQNAGANEIKVVLEDKRVKETALVVVKSAGKEERHRKEPFIYDLARRAGLSCIVPTIKIAANKVAEVFVKFLPEETYIPPLVKSIYNKCKNSYGAVSLLAFNRALTTYKFTRSEKQYFRRNLDKQSLQELELARWMFNLGDLYHRNIMLRWESGKGFVFYHFDTPGVVDRQGPTRVFFADSMGAFPRGNSTLGLSALHKLTPKTLGIIQSWGHHLLTEDLRTTMNDLWPVGTYKGFIRRYHVGCFGQLNPSHGERDSTFIRWMNRLALLQAFILSNSSTMCVGEIQFALLGVTYSEPGGSLSRQDAIHFKNPHNRDKNTDNFTAGLVVSLRGTCPPDLRSFYYDLEALKLKFGYSFYNKFGSGYGKKKLTRSEVLKELMSSFTGNLYGNNRSLKSRLDKFFTAAKIRKLPEWLRRHHRYGDLNGAAPALPDGFSHEIYGAKNPSVEGGSTHPLVLARHYSFVGQAEGLVGLVPTGLQTQYYVLGHSDLRLTLSHLPQPAQQRHAAIHFIVHGEREDRQLVPLPDGFSPEGYIWANPDLLKAFASLTGDQLRLAAEDHYLKTRETESRHFLNGANFFERYLWSNPDLLSQYVHLPEFERCVMARNHYANYGVIEKRTFDGVPENFLWEHYYWTNPKILGDNTSLEGDALRVAVTSHYLNHGINEGGRVLTALPEHFQPLAYLWANQDLIKAYYGLVGQELELALEEHYLRYGRFEAGRSLGLPYTSHMTYMFANPDLMGFEASLSGKELQIALQTHYAFHGVNEPGRKVTTLPPNFVPERYAARNPDLQAVCGNIHPSERALWLVRHYSLHGQGRSYE